MIVLYKGFLFYPAGGAHVCALLHTPTHAFDILLGHSIDKTHFFMSLQAILNPRNLHNFRKHIFITFHSYFLVECIEICIN